MKIEPSNIPREGSIEARLEHAERARFEAEAKYEALLGQLPAAIYAYSPSSMDRPST